MTAPAEIQAENFDEKLPEVPNAEGVFIVWTGEKPAYLAKSGMLRRRMLRVLRPGSTGRSLNLRGLATSVQYWLTGSRFESGLLHYELAKRHYPDIYLKLVKLRFPSYVRLLLTNPFPRTQVSTRIGSSKAVNYGPFRTRASAELFETQMLDLFQIRRCLEDLAPHPDHPGCMYGEMNRCLRPCQQLVDISEYQSEVGRVEDFMRHNGGPLLHTIQSARDRLSEEMDFEEAARQHKRIERIQELLSLRDDLACDIEELRGVAVTASANPGSVNLRLIWKGFWQERQDFALQSDVSLDRRLREWLESLEPRAGMQQERQEHLALLAKWKYSSWRDGEWIAIESVEKPPYRKLTKAISRVLAANSG
ncbi:MAG: hypothetical protein JO022_04340 [Acidobacteriaceae bacterium]|nr:hypothetical protein [Acidobacteriaceae bacterium]